MFGWLWGTPRFKFHEDSYARTRQSTLNGLRKAITDRVDAGDRVLLVAHFPDKFEEIQNSLHSWSLDYDILSKTTGPKNLIEVFNQNQGKILLCLSSLLLIEETVAEALKELDRICVMVIERHPQMAIDNDLENFCRSIPAKVELGYFLSFEDEILKNLINETTLRILDMFGMGQNELITSNMISRRLRFVLNQNSKSYATSLPADSAREWMERNGKSLERQSNCRDSNTR